jgi:uncharacterized membrane-anchored protein
LFLSLHFGFSKQEAITIFSNSGYFSNVIILTIVTFFSALLVFAGSQYWLMHNYRSRKERALVKPQENVSIKSSLGMLGVVLLIIAVLAMTSLISLDSVSWGCDFFQTEILFLTCALVIDYVVNPCEL